MCRVPGTLCSKYGYVVCCAVESTGPACLDEGSSERFSIHACFRYDVSRYLAAPNSELIALSIDYHSHHLTSRAFGISSSGTSRGTPIKCYYSAVSPAQQSPVFFLRTKRRSNSSQQSIRTCQGMCGDWKEASLYISKSRKGPQSRGDPRKYKAMVQVGSLCTSKQFDEPLCASRTALGLIYMSGRSSFMMLNLQLSELLFPGIST